MRTTDARGAARPVVAPMHTGDVDAVTEIDARVYPRPWSRRLYLDGLTDPTRIHVVARVDDMVVGHAGLLVIVSDAHITTVAVDPSWQGRGVATALVADLLRRAIGADCEAATLEVRVGNDAALALYRRFGFAPVGVRKDYYDDPDGRTDALIMWLHDLLGSETKDRITGIERCVAAQAAIGGGR
ncbi:MAG: ribosomal protein S18-alanine N-acetyltransferase [Acidimicrobiia bacterium]|nr:ribosomal protein S18-alanine N-acetyltransferase [Acidimicrobiia bacterium]